MRRSFDVLLIAGLAIAGSGVAIALVGWLLSCTTLLYHPRTPLPTCVETHAVGYIGICVLVSGAMLLAAGMLPKSRVSTEVPNTSANVRPAGVVDYRPNYLRMRSYLQTAGLVLVVVTVPLVTIWYVSASSFTCSGCGSIALSANLELGDAVATYGTDSAISACVASPCGIATVSITVRNPAIEVQDIILQLHAYTGNILISWNATLNDAHGNTIANCASDQPCYPASAGTMNLVSGDSIEFVTSGAAAQPLSGDKIVALGDVDFSGAVSISIP